ncbi:MAG: hypothetical protein IPH62_13750 [Ignavibacteriae bacterium]|nr:hypothetical protein [Ignavibacteriota bacterium]
MKTNIITKIFLLVTILFYISCSSSEVTKIQKKESGINIISKKMNDIDLNIEKTVSWVNLMPGSDSKFHVSGKFIIPQNNKIKIEDIELKFIKVYQEESELYFIQPKTIQKIEKSSKEIIYSTLQGLSLNKNFNKKKNVTFELIFNSNGEELKYYIENINVDEVY